MDSPHKTLIGIASASKRVVDALDRNVDYKTTESYRLDKILVGSRTVLEALNRTLFFKDGSADDRLVDWLESDEPRTCLNTLVQMEGILNSKPEYGVKSFFKASRSTHTRNKVSEAIRLFEMRKSYFHFLLTTGIWNREGGVKRQPQDAHHPLDEPSISLAVSGQPIPLIQCGNRDPPGVAQRQARKRSTVEINQRAKFEKLEDILKWLNAWKPRGTHDRAVLLRQPDTCVWLLNTDAYKKWRSTGNPFLWLYAKPGAGKSVLSAFVIETLKDNLQDGEVLAYFYCDFREERSTSSAGVMRSLLSQLLQHLRRKTIDPGDLIDELTEDKDDGASTVNNAILLAHHISRAVMRFSKQPLLVIDALDECKDVDVLLDALEVLRKGSIRLFVTSRPLQNIKQSLSPLPSIDLGLMNYWMSTDIKLHVTRELDSRLRLRSIDAGLKGEIHSKLCNQAGGMFRLVQCQLNTLDQCMTALEVRAALGNLPSDLDTMYERILLDIDTAKQGSKIIQQALYWLVVALWPLQLSEIMEGLSIDLRERAMKPDSGPLHGSALLEALGSLVMYDEVTDVMILSHFSVKEYLIAVITQIKYPGYYVNQQVAHTQIAMLCMCYISLYLQHGQESNSCAYNNSVGNTSYFKKQHEHPMLPSGPYPLLQYAMHGFHHLAHVNPQNREILHVIRDLQSDAEQHHLKWRHLWRLHGGTCIHPCFTFIPNQALKHDLGLFILIAFAPAPLLHLFISHTKVQQKDGVNSLIYAVYCGKIEHAKILLSKGADVNHRGWGFEEYYQGQLLPLEVAVQQRHCAMVNFLLSEGSHVPDKLFVNALFSMSSSYTIPSLLQTDEFVEWATGLEDEEILLRALNPGPFSFLSGNDVDVIRRRLVQLGFKPRLDEASLRHATSEGSISTVKRMLSLNIHCPPDIILDASCSKNSRLTMIRTFLDMGYQANVTSPIGNTPLHIALKSGFTEEDCLESVQLLINAGCDPSACNLDGKTALQFVARSGYVAIVEYLLSLQVPLPPDILLVPLHSELIHLLIHHGADVHTIAANGDTPLHFALESTRFDGDTEDYLNRVGILINAGCDPLLPNAIGKTVFDVAAEMGRLTVAQYLLSVNVPLPPAVLLHVVDQSDRSGVTPMIKFLIDKGADVHATLDGDTLLHLVMYTHPESECLKRVKLLVNAKCNPRACNRRDRTPFHLAAMQGYTSVLEYLLSLGISVPSDSVILNLFESDMIFPHLLGSYSTIRWLLDRGGDVHTISEAGDTLLHLAANFEFEHDALELTKHLVHAGCNPCTPNLKGVTPLHIAAQHRGHIALIDYYLSLGVSLPPDILLEWPIGNAQVIRHLIAKGAAVSVTTRDGNTPLHRLLAINMWVDVERVKILIHAGCDPRAKNVAGKTPLHLAARHGSLLVVEYLLSQGVPLPHDILCHSAPSLFPFFINRGVDPRSTTANVNMQLMHHALDSCYVEKDSLECAKRLVGAGWDPSLRDAAGKTPIHVVARRGHVSVIQYLLSQSVSLPPDVLLAAMPGDGSLSVDHETPARVRFLIREGADVNAATSNGDTPLHLILRSRPTTWTDSHGHPYLDAWRIVEILLDSGADPSARNTGGQTPFDIAEANGHFFSENFLRLVRNAQRVRPGLCSTTIPLASE